MSDYIRMVFEALDAAGSPDAAGRARVYAECRARVAGRFADAAERATALEALEKVVRRQEMQAIYEEGLGDG